MHDLVAKPRWPLYEKRCREWTAAIKQLQGEFQRDRSGDRHWGFMLGMTGSLGLWIVWATTIGPYPPNESPFDWLLPAQGALLFVLAVMYGRKMFGVRYRFSNGEVAEISKSGHVRWREPLITLGGISFLQSSRYSPQKVVLHWSTHKRAIELYPSIEAAVGEILRASHKSNDESPERLWRCERCGEENPESFEWCWKCDQG